jgi:hypothetical protein
VHQGAVLGWLWLLLGSWLRWRVQPHSSVHSMLLTMPVHRTVGALRLHLSRLHRLLGEVDAVCVAAADLQ